MWEPFGTTPANTTAFWKNGPNERGTLNILSICIITLLLCAYTSLHLDIPDYRKVGWIHRSWERLLWVLAGLAAPEFVAFIACLQWICARKLEDQMTERLGRLLPKSSAAASQDDLEDIPLINDESAVTMRKEPWTHVHSHFALMGGFVFDTSGINPEGKSKRDTLTPQGLRKIAESAPSILPDISKGFIRDKSKANSLAKFLVCVQTIWFIAQTIGRLATGYPISLLELNTLCHAFCCLFIYMAWWHKPLDIEEPYLMNAAEKHISKVWAWMVESDRLNWGETVKPEEYKSSHKLYLVYQDDIDISKEAGSIKTEVRGRVLTAKEYNRHSKKAGKLTFPDYNSQWDTISDARVLRIYPGQSIHGFVLYDDSAGLTYNKFEDIYTTIPADRVNRLRMIDSMRKKEGSTDVWSFTLRKSLLAKRMLNEKSLLMPSDETLMSWKRSRLVNPSSLLWSGVLVAGSLYGGVHLFAWNGPFPTRVQRILWRISCIIITSPAILIAVGFVLLWIGILCWGLFELVGECVAVVNWMVKLARKMKDSAFMETIVTILIIILMVAAAIAYVGARLYLVIECFINVAHLPQGVFLEPNWSMYIPHFGAG